MQILSPINNDNDDNRGGKEKRINYVPCMQEKPPFSPFNY